ncbi:enoyl-CoA delta isomerase 2, peroxisomal-like [Macadamia integrifolia]|uniref:enoyl-CoA delta isomerase 2, peroxisomal-like n=1 Tax=Macadamia integrifolia TaxID=60698 RepID=UPI001C502663|nr:enoyl-CoA delta isomerase 2, peroxisomal-like [Macadamia integrifolia]
MCTLKKRGSVYLLTLTGTDEHRLNPTFMDAILAALRQVRSESTGVPAAALVITAEGKFFSNGLDLPWAKAAGAVGFSDRMRLIGSKFKELTTEIISLPLPTIAAISGHASAGGFILALCHDYILMRKDRGVLYMSELDISFPLPRHYMALIKSKVVLPAAWRDTVLRAVKFRAEAALARGIIDSAHGTVKETVDAALRLGEELAGRKWDGQVYAQMRKTLHSEVWDAFASEDSNATENHIKAIASRL